MRPLRVPFTPAIAALALAFAALALAASSTAGAATIRLGWVETLDRGPAVRVEFRVGSLTTTGHGWSATVEIANRSSGPLVIARAAFAIEEFTTKDPLSRPARRLPAVAFRPKLPASLAPGARWKGTIDGGGTPDDTRYVRLAFGPFRMKAQPSIKPFTWITDHADHVFDLVI